MLIKSEAILRAYAVWLIRHRVWIMAAMLTLTAFFGVQMTSLKLDSDPDLWSPRGHPYIQATKAIEALFGGRNFTVVGVIPKQGDIYAPDVLRKIRQIQRSIEILPEAVRANVVSIAARKAKDISGTADGMEVRELAQIVPSTPAELDRLRQALALNPIYLNSLVAPAGEAAAILADFRLDKTNPSYSALYAKLEAIVDAERDGSVDIVIGGLPVYVASFEAYMQKMPVFFGVALLIIMLIQYLSFRSFQGMLLPTTSGILSVVWALGVMGMLGLHMDGMNTTTPILILAVATGHATQMLKRYYEEFERLEPAAGVDGLTVDALRRSRQALVEALARVGPVMLVIGLIAATAFYSLAMSEVLVVRHFGVLAGSGVVAAVIIEFTLIPSLRALLRPPRRRPAPRASWLDRRLIALSDALNDRRAFGILVACLALIGLAGLGTGRLQVDSSFKRYNAADSQVRKDDDRLNALFGGTNSIIFLVQGAEPDALKDPAVLKAMVALQDHLGRQPGVGKTQSIADLIRRMNLAMHENAAEYDAVPDRRDLIAQYLFLYALSGDPGDFDNFVDNDYRSAAVWVYVKDDSTARAESLYRGARSIIDNTFPPTVTVSMGGSLPQTIAINDSVTQEKVANILQVALVMFVLSALLFRSIVAGLFILIPLVLVVIVNAGLMGWLGLPLDMSAATTVAMAIGIGSDFEIYLLWRLREELVRTGGDTRRASRTAFLTAGKAVVYVAAAIVCGYAVLLVSDFNFYSRLGITVMVTMAIAAASALVLLRAMMMVFRPRFMFGDGGRAAAGQALPGGPA